MQGEGSRGSMLSSHSAEGEGEGECCTEASSLARREKYGVCGKGRFEHVSNMDGEPLAGVGEGAQGAGGQRGGRQRPLAHSAIMLSLLTARYEHLTSAFAFTLAASSAPLDSSSATALEDSSCGAGAVSSSAAPVIGLGDAPSTQQRTRNHNQECVFPLKRWRHWREKNRARRKQGWAKQYEQGIGDRMQARGGHPGSKGRQFAEDPRRRHGREG